MINRKMAVGMLAEIDLKLQDVVAQNRYLLHMVLVMNCDLRNKIQFGVLYVRKPHAVISL